MVDEAKIEGSQRYYKIKEIRIFLGSFFWGLNFVKF